MYRITIARMTQEVPKPGAEENSQDKRVLELGIPFPIFGLKESLDFAHLPDDIVVAEFNLVANRREFAAIPLRIRVILTDTSGEFRFHDWVVESDEDAFSDYKNPEFIPGQSGYNPFFHEWAATDLRGLRFAGTYPITRFKYHTLHTQPFKLRPREKELYGGSLKFGPQMISPKPGHFTPEEYDDYMRRNTWGMFYFHNEERPDQNPQPIPWKTLI